MISQWALCHTHMVSLRQMSFLCWIFGWHISHLDGLPQHTGIMYTNVCLVLLQAASRLKHVFPDKISSDWVGPPDPESNMKLIKFYVPPNETALEKEYRLMRADTQNWHHEFWSKHNKNFFTVIYFCVLTSYCVLCCLFRGIFTGIFFMFLCLNLLIFSFFFVAYIRF